MSPFLSIRKQRLSNTQIHPDLPHIFPMLVGLKLQQLLFHNCSNKKQFRSIIAFYLSNITY